jgi:putative oxidoreductase
MSFFSRLYCSFFSILESLAGDWFLGLVARLTFTSVLLGYFFNSALTKVGSGFPGLLIPSDGAYAQILPSVAQSVGYDVSQISFIPYGLIVTMGTYAEFILPILILIGLFTRISALAMIGFIVVMSYVDIVFHGLGAKDIGAPFDKIHDSIIADQRLLWLFPLIYLVVRGAGSISFDTLFLLKIKK